MDLTKKLIEIQNILKNIEPTTPQATSLHLPNIVVIGSQSSGKSSVLEAIVGNEFLPKGNNMVTRRPIELTLINTPHSSEAYGEFPQLGLDKARDFSQIQRTLYDLNMSVPETECVSDKPIDLRIYSPNVPDLRLVDLPGYIQVTHRKQPPELKQRIHDLCERYLKEPNLILAISAADVDLANSEALLAGRRNDPLGVRTLGIITKIDMTEPTAAVRTLTQKDYPLHLGYIGVICKPIKEKDFATSKELVLSEAQYFTRHTEFQQHGVSVGVGTLRRKLVSILEESMKRNLSRLTDAVQTELEETKYQIKVQYNDQRITAESYMADTLDTIKQRFKQFKQDFGKPQVRSEVRDLLKSRMLDICAKIYWNDPKVEDLSRQATQSRTPGWWTSTVGHAQSAFSGMASFAQAIVSDGKSESLPSNVLKSNTNSNGSATPNSTSKKSQSASGQAKDSEWSDTNVIYWEHQLDSASSILTKSGVGRWTTQKVVDSTKWERLNLWLVENFFYLPSRCSKSDP